MAQATAIEWTDATWNPVHGCSKVSPGCAHCYAETLSRRYGHTPAPWTPANATENVILKPHKLGEPLGWREPRTVFVNSMSDLFHELVPDEYIAEVFSVMCAARTSTRSRSSPSGRSGCAASYGVSPGRPHRSHISIRRGATRTPNRSVRRSCARTSGSASRSRTRRFVHRADLLRDTPAAIRFISAEPLLGPLVPDGWAADGRGRVYDSERWWQDGYAGAGLDLTAIDWLIVGGESGPRHRPIDPNWVRDLRDACWHVDNGRGDAIAFFFKQWGGRTPKAGGRELDGRTWDEMPV
jgi:protein gp37